jgi:tetratricopeptide (TPR) repeat protein
VQQAIKLKGAQMEQQRRAFDSWPAFYQNTLFMSGAVLELRELPVEERLQRARALKEEGNERFRMQAFTAAIELYEQAAGAFRYARQTDSDWRQKGIRDEAIQEVDDLGDPGSDTHSQAVSFVASCYNNLAAAYLGRAARGGEPQRTVTPDADYALCVAACTAVLSLDPTATKALYRRARARVEPMSAAECATDAAIRDLCEASRLSPDDQAVRELLVRLKRDKADKRQADSSTFAKMFGRGTTRAAAASPRLAGRAGCSVGASGDVGSRGGQGRAVRSGDAPCAVGSRVAEDDAPEATERRRRLGLFRRAEAARAKPGTPYINFRNPTPKQREDARMRGETKIGPR